MPRVSSLIAAALLAAGALTPVVATAADPAPPREPSGTAVRAVDGTNVVFSYGEVMPSFDGWRTQEPTRRYLDLDGKWKFRFDPNNLGESAGWQQPDFDDSGWEDMAVPSSWDLKGATGWGSYDGSHFGEGDSLVDGYAWYRRTVDIPQSWRDRYVRLNFLAASYRADVWVNGQYLGAHEGGSTPFAMPVGGAVQAGQPAVIAVRVYRAPSFTNYDGTGSAVVHDDALPPGPVDYWPYAGLTRSLWLEAVPRVAVAKILTNSADHSLDERAVVENHTDDPFTGTVMLNPGDGTGGTPARVAISVPPHGVAVAAADIPIPRAPEWSTAHPDLLTASATVVGGDTLSTTYGMRSVAVRAATLTMNGQPLFLKGVNWHEESPAHGRSMTIPEYNHLLGRVLQAHANFIRNSVYNRDPYVYDWADEHGVLVMDEYDTMWLHADQEQLQTESYGLARAEALATAWDQENHPSVILWGLQNESEIDWNEGAMVYRAWIADMKAAVKSVDVQQRPVTWASSSSWDPAFDLADVIGFNEYFGYFYGNNSDLGPTLDAVHQQYPDKPILITENGSWSESGNHGSADEQGTEEWQAANFDSHWAQVTARPFMAGYTYWVLADYKERDNYNQSLNGISTMGMFDFGATTPRLVFYRFRDAQPPR
jgi:beta-glucuronidase